MSSSQIITAITTDTPSRGLSEPASIAVTGIRNGTTVLVDHGSGVKYIGRVLGAAMWFRINGSLFLKATKYIAVTFVSALLWLTLVYNFNVENLYTNIFLGNCFFLIIAHYLIQPSFKTYMRENPRNKILFLAGLLPFLFPFIILLFGIENTNFKVYFFIPIVASLNAVGIILFIKYIYHFQLSWSFR